MDITIIKIASEIFRNMFLGMGVIVGGFWTYYKFLKGRILCPRIELSMISCVESTEINGKIVGCEVCIKNIGSIRLKPQSIFVEVIGYRYIDEKIDSIIILKSKNILIYTDGGEPNDYYVDPEECSFRPVTFFCPDGIGMFSLEMTVCYNKSFKTKRTFHVSDIYNERYTH